VIRLLVAADDRTGALETAGACADAGCGPVPVTVGAAHPTDAFVVVVDLQTRHLSSTQAGERAAALVTPSGVRAAHKIDSTLRGNWASELVARQRATGARVLVAAALPELGRTCVGGVVLDRGVPVHEGHAGTDARGAVRSSRPADHLRAAGSGEVVEIGSATGVAAWISTASAPSFAVCDAQDADDLAGIGRAWAQDDSLLLAGTSHSIAAAASAVVPMHVWSIAPPVEPPAVVVCGSLSPVARRQVAMLMAAEAPGVFVVASDEPTRRPVDDDLAAQVARELGARARSLALEVEARTIVVIGGDTAAAVLGDGDVAVGGALVPGMAWLHDPGGPLVLTRAGGFGAPDALVRLLAR
jgi:uncharacterized protein YgbK (DUF1537 family)